MTQSTSSIDTIAHPQATAGAPSSRWLESLRLRCRDDGDSAGIFALLSQPDFQRNGCTLDPYTSIDDMEAFARDKQPPALEIVAIVETTVVGFAGIYGLPGRQAHVGSFTLCVHEDFQRRGIGALLVRALVGLGFGPMRLARLQATVFADNARALSLYRRLGFIVEGRLARFVRRDEGFMDAFLIASVPGHPAGSEVLQ